MLGSYTLDDDMVEQLNMCADSLSPVGAWAASSCSTLGDNPEVDMMFILRKLHQHALKGNMSFVATALERACHECYAVHAQEGRQ